VQHHPHVRRRHTQVPTDLLGIQFQPFPHQEHPSEPVRHALDAGLENFKKLPLLQRPLGIGPSSGRIDKPAALVEQQRVEILSFVAFGVDGNFTVGAPKVIEPSDAKLAALYALTAELVRTHGMPAAATVQAFLQAGYDERTMLYLVLAAAVKTLSNFSNHAFATPVDERFAAYRVD
jgi:hypothetical protein